MHDRRREHSIKLADDDAKDLLAVQKTLQGDTGAFSDIVNRYTPIVYSLAARLLENREEVEDAVQEIFLNAYRSLRSFKIGARFYSWFYTIAVNKIRSLLRKKHRIGVTVSLDNENMPDLPDRREDLQLKIISRAEEERARELLSSLKPIYRIAFVLRFVEGMSIDDMATILDVPVGTVKARLHRARKQLISILTED
jgi:RNA polymerase sigma-70 factor (ECF subfamily)